MNGNLLLDTNIVIALFAGDQAVLEYLSKSNGVYIPSIVIGELNYGARKSTRVKENLERIDQFCASNTILSCDAITASYYGNVKDQLRLKGKPIPDNDIWIASIAPQHGLMLSVETNILKRSNN